MHTDFCILASAFALEARQIPRRSRELGFAGLVFDAITPTMDLTRLSMTGRREFKLLLSNENQQLPALQCNTGVKGFAPGADVDRLLDRIEQVLHLARDLSVGAVILDVGPLPAAPKVSMPKPRVTPEQAGLILIPDFAAPPEPAPASPTPAPDSRFVAQVESAIMSLASLADRFSVTIALRSDLAGYASLESVLSRVRCPWLGVELDMLGLLRDELDDDEIFSLLGGHLLHVRLRDAQLGDDRRTRATPIGQGEASFAAVFSMLDASDYRGARTIDTMDLPDRLGAAVAGLAVLKSIR